MTHDQSIDYDQPDCTGALEDVGADSSDPSGIARIFRCRQCGTFLYGTRRVFRSRPVGKLVVEALDDSIEPKQATNAYFKDLIRDFRLPPRQGPN